MKIAIGNDHVGIELKQTILEELNRREIEVIDCGTDTADRTDYPIYAEKVANLVASGEVDKGIIMCGTGVGISIAANKVNGIRCVNCSEPYSAVLSRQHNNTNMLSLGSRVIGKELARMIVNGWLDAVYEGDRHQKRIDLIREMEKRQK
jgi:ribose 5-phosphate isomerase B